MTRFAAASATLVGQVRAANEDAVLVADGLAAVADGMGGHNAGEVASASTVQVLGRAAGARSVEDLVASVHRANRSINEQAAADRDLYGMGTTVCLAGLVRYDGVDEVAVLNVGDSRVYLLADGELHRLTEDHSLVEGLVREGRISPEEAEVHPQRNVLTRALGVEPLVVVDAWLLSPCDGDRLLLCSDGLFNELDEARIRDLLAEAESPEVTARRLAAEADAAGGRDNVSVVVVDLADTGRAAAPWDDRYRRITTPAVDLSDPDDHGPRTDTQIAVVAPRPDDDLDGDDQGGEDDLDDEPADGGDADPGDGPAADGPGAGVDDAADGHAVAGDDGHEERRGHRWQTLLWAAAMVGVVAVAVGAVLFNALRDDPTARPPTTTATTSTTAPPTTTSTVVVTTLAPTVPGQVAQPGDAVTVPPAPGDTAPATTVTLPPVIGP